MARFALVMYNPADAYVPAPEEMEALGERWGRFYADLAASGALVANQGLAGPESATTVRVRDGQTQIVDGPFAETKELLAGFFLIDVDDLDAALGWAARMPAAERGSVEVRPGWG